MIKYWLFIIIIGHAGAIIAGGKGGAQEKVGNTSNMVINVTIFINDKINALKDAGVHVANSPAKIGEIMKQVKSQAGIIVIYNILYRQCNKLVDYELNSDY